VFRAPASPMLFSILVGTGYHIATVAFFVILLAIMDDLYTGRGIQYNYLKHLINYLFLGSLLTASIFVYAATSPVNGYFGGSLYAQFGGRKWIKQMALSAFALPSLICGTAFLINFIAIYYHASRAIPFGTMVV